MIIILLQSFIWCWSDTISFVSNLTLESLAKSPVSAIWLKLRYWVVKVAVSADLM